MLTFAEARNFIENASKRGSVLGLESIRRLMEELSLLVLGEESLESAEQEIKQIQDLVPVIHIAGTNGKGSVGAYLASIFREAGLHVARYTSPAVFEPLEVWQLDGKNITETEYAKLMSQVKEACDIMAFKGEEVPTVFEIETAAAFLYFYWKKPDVAILEVGMGGKTDATNVIAQPLASVITTISFDHMQFLGSSLKEIAEIKAGIIKMQSPVFSAEQEEVVAKVLKQKAKENQTTIKFISDSSLEILEQHPEKLVFSYAPMLEEKALRVRNSLEDGEIFLREREVVSLESTLAGCYQMKNAALAYECARELLPALIKELEDLKGMGDGKEASFKERKEKQIQECQIREWLKNGIAKATWPGRFEVLETKPYVIIDGAHNEDAAKQLAKTLQNCFTNKSINYIIGVLADKEHEKMLQIMLPFAKKVYTVTPKNPRAMSAEELAIEAKSLSPEKAVIVCESCEEALKQAKKNADVVLAFGSLSYLREIKNLCKK